MSCVVEITERTHRKTMRGVCTLCDKNPSEGCLLGRELKAAFRDVAEATNSIKISRRSDLPEKIDAEGVRKYIV
jgi:hypothetical protein